MEANTPMMTKTTINSTSVKAHSFLVPFLIPPRLSIESPRRHRYRFW